MTAAILTGPALAAGSALAGSAGRAGLWVFGYFARAPLASTAIIAMVGLSAMAGSNALYFQTARHPSPFFSEPIGVVGEPEPELAGQPQVTPAKRSAPLILEPTVTPETTSTITPEVATIGNEDVAALQQKLKQLRLFDGDVDGYYGPMTAQAIRAFELANGLKPLGALSPDVMAAIMRAPVTDPVRMETPVVTADPDPALTTASIEPQRMPDPLPALEPQPVDDPFIAAAEGAEATLDAIAGMVQEVNAQRTIVTPMAATTTPPAEVRTTIEPAPTTIEVAATPEAIVEPLPMMPTDPQALASTIVSNDVETVTKVQRGLASLGFLHGAIDGVPGEATAKAIRNFEVFNRYKVTGQITPDLVDLLIEKGAAI